MSSTQKKCSKCQDDFLIIEQEKKFLDEKGLPQPTECPICRQKRRESQRSGHKLYGHKCDNCKKDIIIAFQPPEDQNIFCRTCYLDYYDKNDAVQK